MAQVQQRDLGETLAALRAGQFTPLVEGDQSTYECVVSGSLNGKPLKPGRFEILRSGKRILSKKGTSVTCRNDEAVFVVQKSKDGTEWVIVKHVRSDLDGAWRKSMPQVLPLYSPLQAFNEDWDTPSMIDDPEFKPLRARTVAGGRVEVDYTYLMPVNQNGERKPMGGTITLAPELNWAVVKATSRAEDTPAKIPIVSEMTREAERVGGEIQVKSVTIKNLHGDTNAVLNSFTYTFKPLSADSVNPAEFTLEYYKISPPADDVHEDRPAFNWPLWGGIAVGCIALSIFLAWLVRRKRKSA